MVCFEFSRSNSNLKSRLQCILAAEVDHGQATQLFEVLFPQVVEVLHDAKYRMLIPFVWYSGEC